MGERAGVWLSRADVFAITRVCMALFSAERAYVPAAGVMLPSCCAFQTPGCIINRKIIPPKGKGCAG